jgi:hypothetical protein
MATTKVTNRVLEVDSVGTAQLSAGAVTLDKLITTIQQALLPVGAVQAFARTSAPAGWLICNGDAIGTTGTVQGIAANSLTALRNVFLADSNPFGVSSSNPLLPDLRGYFVRGSGTNSDGTAAGTFGAKQADEFRSHRHSVPNLTQLIGGRSGVTGNFNKNDGGTNSEFTDFQGGTETRPRNIALLYCIKF